MTREEARQNLVALGIEEPTDAQVTNYLNQFHSNRPQPQPAPIQQPPTPTPTPNPEPEPSGNEDIENLRNQIAQLQSENAQKDIRAYAAEKGLTGEQTANILKAFGNDVGVAKESIDAICQVISDRESAAATAREQEIANGATNPGGGSVGGSGADDKSQAEKIATKLFGGKKQDNNILSHYVNGGN